jgi:hypothetical protein
VGVPEREPCIGWSCNRAIDICEANTECVKAIQRASGVYMYISLVHWVQKWYVES